MDPGIRKISQGVLLILLSVAFLAHLWRSVSTGEDLPSNWTYFMGALWGILLGIREFLEKRRGGDRDGP